MIIKTIQWNIGGGRYRNLADDPLGDFYLNEDIKYFKNYINHLDPDIITLQESHLAENYSIAKEITQSTNLKYYEDFALAQSHIDPKYRLCISIISKSL